MPGCRGAGAAVLLPCCVQHAGARAGRGLGTERGLSLLLEGHCSDSSTEHCLTHHLT